MRAVAFIIGEFQASFVYVGRRRVAGGGRRGCVAFKVKSVGRRLTAPARGAPPTGASSDRAPSPTGFSRDVCASNARRTTWISDAGTYRPGSAAPAALCSAPPPTNRGGSYRTAAKPRAIQARPLSRRDWPRAPRPLTWPPPPPANQRATKQSRDRARRPIGARLAAT